MTSIQQILKEEKQRMNFIRRQLKLRQRPTGEWEVYTVIHGCDVFRWFIISAEKAIWYRTQFPEIETIPFKKD